MEYKQIHDYLTVSEKELDVHHMHFLSWLKTHSNFLVGIEKFFLILRDDLAKFIHTEYKGSVNKELIDDYARKGHFNLLEKKEGAVLSDVNNFRLLCKKERLSIWQF